MCRTSRQRLDSQCARSGTGVQHTRVPEGGCVTYPAGENTEQGFADPIASWARVRPRGYFDPATAVAPADNAEPSRLRFHVLGTCSAITLAEISSTCPRGSLPS
jgi:hypothetical protein